jgi:valacyclovir hydrolase
VVKISPAIISTITRAGLFNFRGKMGYFSQEIYTYFYREQGQGPLVIILPGNTASSACHGQELAFFAGLGYHAVSFDFLGTGQSDRISGPWPLDWWQQNGDAAVALLAHLGQEQAILAGCSGGTLASLWAAIRHPGQIRAVIADSEMLHCPPGYMAAETRNRAQRTPAQVAFWSAAQGEDWEDVVNADSDLFLRLEAANPDGIEFFHGRLAEIRCPVLFTVSLTDSLLHQPGNQALEAAQSVPESWLFAVNGGGHPLMWSRPAAYQAAVKGFLSSLS